MRVRASRGNAPQSASLDDTVYKLTLTALTRGEKQWLAELLKAVGRVDPRQTKFKTHHVPQLSIVEDIDVTGGDG